MAGPDRSISADLAEAGIQDAHRTAAILRRDARELRSEVALRLVDAVSTSAPYLNGKDHTRAARLETVMLGFTAGEQEVRALKRRR